MVEETGEKRLVEKMGGKWNCNLVCGFFRAADVKRKLLNQQWFLQTSPLQVAEIHAWTHTNTHTRTCTYSHRWREMERTKKTK